jgi:multisubunit Na+/H+ antiporter MnhF subunit
MSLSGWIVMLVSVSFVTAFLAWCIYRVLKEPEAPERMHALDEIDTHDQE